MKLNVVSLDPSLLEAARYEAATSGWLLETPERLRCGFGGALLERSMLALNELGDTGSLFRQVECARPELMTAFAAVPFSREQPFSYVVPRYTVIAESGELWLLHPDGDVPTLSPTVPPLDEERAPSSLTFEPSPDAYAEAVAAAVQELRDGHLDKVVLARRCRGEFDAPVNGWGVVQRLRALEPSCTLYAVPTGNGQRFTGASPELLVSAHGTAVHCHPLAGTISTEGLADPSKYTSWLLGSTKNRNEHRFVVDDIVSLLSTRLNDVVADEAPSIVALRSVSHLGTTIRATRGAAPTSLELVALLHPTPAVGGLPRDAATSLISELEALDRGNYAGAVGWENANGDGSWWVAIRGILTVANTFEIWAGAGIVADSDPIAEREETRDKMASVLRALGVPSAT